MTREKLKQMGEAAGISPHAFGLATEEAWQQVERFAALVAAAEREACADVCDRLARRYGDGPGLEHFQQGFGDGAWVSAKKIRERGQE